ncbi:MAG: hypothetical protein IPJ47_21325 [Anaerolineales bacterium]|nr:hypothetical protein [Anaerolineales bacterium]
MVNDITFLHSPDLDRARARAARHQGSPLSIDFTGGTLLEVSFADGKTLIRRISYQFMMMPRSAMRKLQRLKLAL